MENILESQNIVHLNHRPIKIASFFWMYIVYECFCKFFLSFIHSLVFRCVFIFNCYFFGDFHLILYYSRMHGQKTVLLYFVYHIPIYNAITSSQQHNHATQSVVPSPWEGLIFTLIFFSPWNMQSDPRVGVYALLFWSVVNRNLYFMWFVVIIWMYLKTVRFRIENGGTEK